MTKPRTTKSRRLRKKLFLDEFAVQGFGFTCQINTDDQEKLDTFFDGLVDLIEQRNLCFGGGGSQDNFQGYIVADGRYDSATEDDRKAVGEWLNAQDVVGDCSIDGLTDAYYD